MNIPVPFSYSDVKKFDILHMQTHVVAQNAVKQCILQEDKGRRAHIGGS